jgi:hypothetical protein
MFKMWSEERDTLNTFADALQVVGGLNREDHFERCEENIDQYLVIASVRLRPAFSWNIYLKLDVCDLIFPPQKSRRNVQLTRGRSLDICMLAEGSKPLALISAAPNVLK